MTGAKSSIARATISRFDLACDDLLVTEGGLVDNPKDPGGITRFGISLRFLVATGRLKANRQLCDVNRDGTIDGQDIRDLSREQARGLYRSFFWEAYRLGDLPRPFDAIMLDQCVNLGPGTAVRLLENVVGCPANGIVDRATIDATVKAIARHGQASTVLAYKAAAKTHYQAIAAANPRLQIFVKGWTNRVERLGRV